MEDALHWLSTLGGAYSNLGDHSEEFAVKAGVNAVKQMKIALEFNREGDPSVLHRCWLFVAMSLMQQKRLKKSKTIIQSAYEANNARGALKDDRVEKMCLGIWARLKHAYVMRKTP